MKNKKEESEKKDFPGYPIYPGNEDIYNNERKVENPDRDAYYEINNSTEGIGKFNEKGFSEDESGDDLDVPGSEFDDDTEEPGNEDEENEYYSLGGDDHDDLEEDRGEDLGDYIP